MQRRSFTGGLAAAATLAGPARQALAQGNVRIVGAGASFPFPLYSQWVSTFSRNNRGVQIDYQSTGSGAGVRAFIERTIDFGASDAGMTDEEIAKVDGGALLFPMTGGEIVLAYNLPGVQGLKLPREIYPALFLGQIERWNDPRIAAANPGLRLPDTRITIVRRSDASGTTFVFTKHLSAISKAFADTVGTGTNPQWPRLNQIVAAPRNDGVTATITQTPGSVGYIEWGFAKLTNTPAAQLQNASGTFVAPGGDGGRIALADAKFPSADDLRVWVDDPQAAAAYPITTFTWMLFYRKQDAAKAEWLRKFVEWSLGEGQTYADKTGYIPLPAEVIEKIRAKVPLIA
jgi:phosphate transport system substrate-binding protein